MASGDREGRRRPTSGPPAAAEPVLGPLTVSQSVPDVEDVFFSQHDINAAFGNTTTNIYLTLFALREGLQSIEDFPKLKIVYCAHLSGYISIDNSQLWLMKRLPPTSRQPHWDVVQPPYEQNISAKMTWTKRRGNGKITDVNVRGVPCEACRQLCTHWEMQRSQPTWKRFAKHIVESHVDQSYFSQLGLHGDAGRLTTTGDLLRVLREKSGTSDGGRICSVCDQTVQVLLTHCSRRSRCSVPPCSNKYPCLKTHLQLSCGHGGSVEGDYDYRNAPNYLGFLYKLHIELEQSVLQ